MNANLYVITNKYQVLDPSFGKKEAASGIELDLGCAKGKFSRALAERYPDRLILAADVMLGRLRKAAKKAARTNLANLLFLRAESMELFGYQLPDNTISRIHILCPDPWPKKRHSHRRLITTDFSVKVARVLEPGGILHISTDDTAYFETMRTIISDLPFFEEAPHSVADVADLSTEFEEKWEANGKTVPHTAYTLV